MLVYFVFSNGMVSVRYRHRPILHSRVLESVSGAKKWYRNNTNVYTSIYGKKVAFISIYAPTVFEDNFFHDLTEESLKLTEYELVLGGDMDAVCNLDLDRCTSSFTHSQQSASTALNTMIDNMSLFDVWWSQNPGSRDYTCFSAYHKSFSRIDYFLLSRGLKDCVTPVKLLPATLADHNRLILSIDLSFKFKTSQTQMTLHLSLNLELNCPHYSETTWALLTTLG